MNIPNSLLVRIWGPFLAMACGLLFLTGVYVPLQQKRALEKFQREELQVIAETVAQAVDNAFANNELQSATRAFSLLRDRESIAFGAYYFEGDTTVISFPEGISFGRIMAQAEANLYVTAKFDTPFGAGVVVIRGLDAFVERELALIRGEIQQHTPTNDPTLGNWQDRSLLHASYRLRRRVPVPNLVVVPDMP